MSPKSGQTPHYELQSFLIACKEGTNAVYVRPTALIDANYHFGLPTQKEAVRFVASISIDDFVFKNSGKLDMNLRHIDAVFDAYSFPYGKQHGFLAFFRVNENTKWQIKSLKKDFKSPLTDRPFAAKLAGFETKK